MTLPNPALEACVVVPARDEEDLIRSCLEAIATQERVSLEEYEVLVILDGCTDETEERARHVGDVHPSLQLHFLDGPGQGSGPARRVGMDAACDRLLQVGRPEGLIACTDADTVVAPDWLAAQLRAVSAGASNSPTMARCRRVCGAGTRRRAACDMSAFSLTPIQPARHSTGSSPAPP
jgi:glucosyl-3-phosphoglycerate synthase